ncbi:unnamed protein product, partial [Pleuronectes platessa]
LNSESRQGFGCHRFSGSEPRAGDTSFAGVEEEEKKKKELQERSGEEEEEEEEDNKERGDQRGQNVVHFEWSVVSLLGEDDPGCSMCRPADVTPRLANIWREISDEGAERHHTTGRLGGAAIFTQRGEAGDPYYFPAEQSVL